MQSNRAKTVVKMRKVKTPMSKLLANASINLFAIATPIMFLTGGVEYIAGGYENYEIAYSANKLHLIAKGGVMISAGFFVTAALLQIQSKKA